MFWDVWEAIVDWFKFTLKPALKNLFSSKKNFVGMFLAVFLLQTLLCIICIAGVSNIISQNELLNDVERYITEDEELLWAVEVIANSTMILIGALCIWVICALTVYWKMTVAAADRSRYVWGMFICYGSARKKILKMLLCELYVTMLTALGLAYPTAYFICSEIAPAASNIIASPASFWIAFIIVFIAVRLCASFQTRLICRHTCVSLLGGEGVIENIISPRRSGKLVAGFTPFRAAKTLFWRSRWYYASLALAAALPAVIWICCQTASVSEMIALEADIYEFSISTPTGLSSQILEDEYIDELNDIEGVSSIRAEAYGSAYSLGIHVLVENKNTTENSEYVKLNDVYADSDIFFVSSDDLAFNCNSGLTYSVEQGEAVIILGGKYKYDVWDEDVYPPKRIDKYIMICPASVEDAEYPENLIDDSYEYLKFKLTDTQSNSNDGKYFAVDGTYIILHPEDYGAVTSLDAGRDDFVIKNKDISVYRNLYKDGSFEIAVPSELLSTMPKVGGVIVFNEAEYSYKAEMDFITDDKTLSEEERFEHIVRNGILTSNKLMIYGVREEGENIYMRVAPAGERIIMKSFPGGDNLSIRIGTPEFNSTRLSIIARTYEGDFSVEYGKISLLGNANFKFESSVSGKGIGSFAISESVDIAEPSGMVKLEDVFASNNFTLVCGDSMTVSSLGFEDIGVSEGRAVAVIPKNGNLPFMVNNGEDILISITIPFDPSKEPDNFKVLNDKNFLLERQLEANKYQYVRVTIDEVVVGDVDDVYIFVDENTYSSVIGLEKPYTHLGILIRSDLTPVEYSNVTAEISEWVRLTSTDEEPITFTTIGEYFGVMLRAAADYSVWLKVIALMTPMLIPLIWYYPQSMTFARRRNDCKIMLDIGRRKRELRRMFLWESLMAAGVAVLGVILLTPIGILLFDITIYLFELPLEFDSATFDVKSFVFALFVSAFCAAMTVIFGGTSAIEARKNRRERKENGAS